MVIWNKIFTNTKLKKFELFSKSIQDYLDAVKQICFGLKYLHSKKIIHRDIKPKNILITKEGTLKLCDLEYLRSDGSSSKSIIGTLHYMAPEMKNSNKYSDKVDIYSLGRTILQLYNKTKDIRKLPEDIYILEDMKMKCPFLHELCVGCLENDPMKRLSSQKILFLIWKNCKNEDILEKDCKKFVLDAVKQDGYSLLKSNEALKNDREIVLEAVKQDGYLLQYAGEELKNDREIVLEAVKEYGYLLEFAGEELKNDREIVLEAVKQNGYSLQYASEKLKNDKEIVLEAVKEYGNSLHYASEKLKNDKEFVFEAVKENGYSFQYAGEELKSDKEFVLEVVKQNGFLLEFASEELKKEIVLEANASLKKEIWK